VTRVRAAATVVVAVFLGSCKLKDPVEKVSLTNAGTLCVGTPSIDFDAGKAFSEVRPDQGVPIIVRSACLADSCVTDRQASCSIKREGDRLIVTSAHSWTGPQEIGKCAGNNACTPIDARCTSEPLPEGKYTFVLGKQAYPVTVPSRVESGCLSVPKLARVPLYVSDSDGGTTPVAPASAPPQPQLQPAAVAALAAPPTTGAPPTAPAPTATICLVTPPPPPPPKKGKAPPPKKVPGIVSISTANACTANACVAEAPKCTVKAKGKSTLVVTTSYGGTPKQPAKPKSAPCTEDCPRLVAQCKTEPLAAGTYTLEADGRSGTVSVPAGSKPNCLP
jgi:hypothetical protein